MKDYLSEMIDLTGDSYLNPVPAVYDNGVHNRNVSDITSISVHHDASDRPHDYDSVKRYYDEAAQHYQRLGPGLQYHYKIDNVGQIFKVRPHEVWLYVVGSAENTSCLAVCLDGDFETGAQVPTREQYEALSQLLDNLSSQHPEFPATYPNCRAHRDYSATDCCGDSLVPYVFQINDKATCFNYPAEPFDWPQYQPGAGVPSAPQPTPPSDPATIPNPPVPATPPSPAPADQSHDYTPQLDRIETLLNWIKDLLSKIFK